MKSAKFWIAVLLGRTVVGGGQQLWGQQNGAATGDREPENALIGRFQTSF